jgi:hypothetical protein
MNPIRYQTNKRGRTKKSSTIDFRTRSPFSELDEALATSWKPSCGCAKARAREQVRVEKSLEIMMDCFLQEDTLSSSGLYGNHLYNGE